MVVISFTLINKDQNALFDTLEVLKWEAGENECGSKHDIEENVIAFMGLQINSVTSALLYFKMNLK